MSLSLSARVSAVEALERHVELLARIRQEPQRLELRILHFQILCIQGEWAKAAAQLKVIEGLSPEPLPMVGLYRPLLQCEPLRQAVFAGRRTPLVLGEPAPWLAQLLESHRLQGQGHAAHAQALQAQALDEAPARPGTLDGEPFDWLADADPRLGPILEAIVNGKYCWIPMQHLDTVEIEPPVDLRDLVWTPATLTFGHGGQQMAMLPTRYPGTEQSADLGLKLARQTIWQDQGDGLWAGLGQRMFTTDRGEHALLDIRRIAFIPPMPTPTSERESPHG